MTITYEDYLHRIDAMTLSDLMMMHEVAAQKPAGGESAAGGWELETVDGG